MGLNSAQVRAIAHKSGPCLVLAGPGSGKTTVITRRVQYLIEKYKVNPEEILVITFSKAAAREMKERFQRLSEGRYGEVTFGTFHAIFYSILKWAYQITQENIFSEEQKYQLLQQIVQSMSLDFDDEKEFLQGIAGEIGVIKNNLIPLEKYCACNCEDNIFKDIFLTYEKERKEKRKLDFDDMLVQTLELLCERPEVLCVWQKKYKYILIDEFQDINKVQYEVVRMLAAPQNNLFVVGDDDQSIYRFRGASPQIMLGFPKDYPDAKQVILDINYRSTKTIISCANRVIENNQKRYLKQVVTENERGVNVHVQEVKTSIEESRYVVGEIQKALKEGVEPGEIAVLFRTNHEARALVDTCMEYGIPFQMKESFANLYEHFIARDLMAYMKLALGDRSRNLFLKVMNRPNRYLHRACVDSGQVDFEEIRKFYNDKDWMLERIAQMERDLLAMKKCAPYAAIRYLRKHVGYDVFLEEYARKRKMNLDELYEVLDEVEEQAKKCDGMESWFEYIEKYSQALQLQMAEKDTRQNAIQFMTMHGAKGLEYRNVFVISVNETILPYKKVITNEEIEEERRLLYVAMTRAKKRLFLTYYKEKNGKKMEASRFLFELLKKTKN